MLCPYVPQIQTPIERIGRSRFVPILLIKSDFGSFFVSAFGKSGYFFTSFRVDTRIEVFLFGF